MSGDSMSHNFTKGEKSCLIQIYYNHIVLLILEIQW